MRVLQFGFDGDGPGSRHHQPHRYAPNSVAYTGTHDNETIVQWMDRIARKAQRAFQRLSRYVGDNYTRLGDGPRRDANPRRGVDPRIAHWAAIRAVMASPANTVIFPVQDVLGLGAAHRMNVPSIGVGNWEWRVCPGALTPQLARRLREETGTFERLA